MARLSHLNALVAGWDGYRGRPVDAAIAKLALEVLGSVCHAATPQPSLVPGSSGDLQIEWHTSRWDLEIDLVAPHRIEAWRRDDATLAEEELVDDLDRLRGWVADLEEPAIASRATTA